MGGENQLRSLIEYSAIFLMMIVSVLLRSFAVVRHGPMIEEFDPQFNMLVAEYIDKHSLRSFFEWYDNGSWYPMGRHIGSTAYPGLMFTSCLIKDFLASFHIFIDIETCCIWTGPVFSILNIFFTFKLGCLFLDSRFGLLCAFVATFSPGQILSSSAGEYDYESIGAALIVAIFYFFLKGYLSSSLPHVLCSALITGWLGFTWGGFIYPLAVISIYTLALIAFGHFSMFLHEAFTTWAIVAVAIFVQAPPFTLHSFMKMEMLPFMGTFAFLQGYLLIKYLHIHPLVLGLLVLMFGLLIGIPELGGRILNLIDPTQVSNRERLESLVQEHQPSTWSCFFTYGGIFTYFIPLSFYILVKDFSPKSLYILSVTLPAFLLSATMNRVLRVFCVVYVFLAAVSFDKLLRGKWSVFKLVLVVFGLYSVTHGVYLAANDISDNYLNYEIETKDGVVYSQDHLEGFRWMAENTAPDSRIGCWWDLGYQIRRFSGRYPLTDGFTTNSTHISVNGLIFALHEQDSWRISRAFGVDYVVLLFGGGSGFRGDDLMKFTHVGQLISKHYTNVSYKAYEQSPYDLFNVGPGMGKELANSALFKMSYNNFKRFKHSSNYSCGYDFFRMLVPPHLSFNLKYYQEAYTTENWMIRVYKVKPDPLWNAVSKPS